MFRAINHIIYTCNRQHTEYHTLQLDLLFPQVINAFKAKDIDTFLAKCISKNTSPHPVISTEEDPETLSTPTEVGDPHQLVQDSSTEKA